jgi:hypothetical protein
VDLEHRQNQGERYIALQEPCFFVFCCGWLMMLTEAKQRQPAATLVMVLG